MPSSIRRAVSVAAALSLVCVLAAGPAGAGASAVLAGRVTAADGATPRSGVVVHLVPDGASDSVASAATDPRGAFRMEAAPVGTFRVLVEAPEGAFLAPDSISLREGEEAAPVLVALRMADPPEEGGTEPTPGTPPPPAARAGLPTWAKWTIVGVAALGAGFVIKQVTDEDEASDL
jgi:hypothetical protein